MQWSYFFEDTPHTISFRLPYGPYHLSASKKEVINLEKSHDLVWLYLMTSGRKLIELHPDTLSLSASAPSTEHLATEPKKKDVK